MKPAAALIISFFVVALTEPVDAQTVLNGTLESGTASWSCSAETNPESVYGGSGGNSVAEIDAEAGLCQTISGFTVGSYYNLSFLCSRRTTCGPTFQSLKVTLGGDVNYGVSRNGTAFSLDPESVNFIATSSVMTLTFASTTPPPDNLTTCNLLVDNIAITLVSALPVMLGSFSVSCDGNAAVAEWTTESENRNNYFTLQRSADAQNWQTINKIPGVEYATTPTHYSFSDAEVPAGTVYYRLLQTNLDGKEQLLATKALVCSGSEPMVFPNPVSELLSVRAAAQEINGIFDLSGRKVFTPVNVISDKEVRLDVSALNPGAYYLVVGNTIHKIIRK